jgi:hypothetical protein
LDLSHQRRKNDGAKAPIKSYFSFDKRLDLSAERGNSICNTFSALSGDRYRDLENAAKMLSPQYDRDTKVIGR